jgi:hypothetical protein
MEGLSIIVESKRWRIWGVGKAAKTIKQFMAEIKPVGYMVGCSWRMRLAGVEELF